jgi:A/G-specific adenine glycosylase
MKFGDFSSKVVEWYQEHHRALPWRSTKDPYKVWLSEIILQQTRVLQGLPYYLEFVRRYPTVRALASASEREILRLWQGLGYYSRARNLRKCALTVVKDHKARFPNSFEKLKTLPGIGDYTAAAIASFSFDEPVAVVDGNVFRVLSRVFGLEDNIMSPGGKKTFTLLANRLLSKTDPGLHNQAMMEFGAMQCTPRNPKCEDCVMKRNCVAYRQGSQLSFPVKEKPRKRAHRYFYYLVARDKTKLRMSERKNQDIWKGLFDFPLLQTRKQLSKPEIFRLLGLHILKSKEKNDAPVISQEYRHILTHQVIHARFISMDYKKNNPAFLNGNGKDSAFYSVKEIASLPKPVLISRYLRDNHFL